MNPAELTSGYEHEAGKVLLLDADRQHADALIERLRSHKLRVDAYSDPQQAIAQVRRKGSGYEVVIVNVSARSEPWFKTLQQIDQACRRSGVRQRPLLLCVSTNQQQPEFVLRIERTGARYVRER